MARDCQGVAATLIDIRLGDCLDVLRTIPDGSARMCVTSPPYYGLRDYGVDGQIGLEATPDAFIAKMVEVFREVRRVLADDGTLWLNLGDSYASSGRSDRKESPGVGAKQEMKKPGRKLEWQAGGGHNFTWFIPAFGTKIKSKDLLGIPWRVAFALQADGWYLRSDIIWHKPNPMPESVRDRPTKAHEYLFLLSKQPRYYYDAEAVREEQTGSFSKQGNKPCVAAKMAGTVPGIDGSSNELRMNGHRSHMEIPGGRNARTVWTITPRPFKGAHFATFPAELAERCVKAGSAEGDTVLDPFAGAGTVGLVCQRLGRDHLGIELNPEYRQMAIDRIASDSPMPLLESVSG
jgi:DNA modification methylase